MTFEIYKIFVFFLSSCVVKDNPPEFVKLTDNITVHKSRTDETTGCTMYLPISKNTDITKAVIYFVYFEQNKLMELFQFEFFEFWIIE